MKAPGKVTLGDWVDGVDQAFKRIGDLSPHHLAISAYHEAGHAVIACFEGIEIDWITIIPCIEYGGRTQHEGFKNGEQYHLNNWPQARDKGQRLVRIMMAGSVADRKFQGKRLSGRVPGSDYTRSWELCMGLSENDEKEAVLWQRLLMHQTIKSVNEHWEYITRLTAALMERGRVEGSELDSVLFPESKSA